MKKHLWNSTFNFTRSFIYDEQQIPQHVERVEENQLYRAFAKGSI